MLVLTRKVGESVVLFDGDKRIEVVVVKKGNQVKLGIKAPESVEIKRSELVGNVLDVKG